MLANSFIDCSHILGLKGIGLGYDVRPDNTLNKLMDYGLRFGSADAEGRFHLPFVYRIERTRDEVTLRENYNEDTTTRYPIRLLVRGSEYEMWGLWKLDLHLFGLPVPQDEQGVFLLGADRMGRDLFSRMCYGARISLSVGLVGVLLSLTLGIVLGGISGYYGGRIDTAIQRVIEFIRIIPAIPLWMALSAALPRDWPVVRVYFGITVLLSGTLTSSMVALGIAVPVGTVIAIYLSEFAPFGVREVAKPFLEMLGGVPTIVYGYFALLFVTPLLQRIYPELPGFNLLGAGIVMGIMIIPYVSSIAEDAMRAVPMSLREGSYAMGATRFQTATRVVVPAAISGIASAYILGISRAVGETMILAVAAGMQPNLTFNPLEPAATITAFIVQVALGDLPHGSVGYQTIFAAGLTLFLVTLAFNIGGHVLRKRFREAY